MKNAFHWLSGDVPFESSMDSFSLSFTVLAMTVGGHIGLFQCLNIRHGLVLII